MELDLVLVRNRVQVMQHIDGRRHQAASINVVLELTCQTVAGRGLTHFVEQLAILIQEIQTFCVLFSSLVVKRKGLFAKAVLEQCANSLVTFRIVTRIRFAHLL